MVPFGFSIPLTYTQFCSCDSGMVPGTMSGPGWQGLRVDSPGHDFGYHGHLDHFVN